MQNMHVKNYVICKMKPLAFLICLFPFLGATQQYSIANKEFSNFHWEFPTSYRFFSDSTFKKTSIGMVYFETEGKFEQVNDTLFLTYTKIVKWPGDPNAKPKINELRFDTLVFKNQYEFWQGEYCLSKIYYDNNNIKEDKFFRPNLISGVSKINYETKKKGKKGDTTGATFTPLKIPNAIPRGTWKYYNKKGELTNQIEFDDSGKRVFQEEDTLEVVYIKWTDYVDRKKKRHTLYKTQTWYSLKFPLFSKCKKSTYHQSDEKIKVINDTFDIVYSHEKNKTINISNIKLNHLIKIISYLNTDTIYQSYDTLTLEDGFNLISATNQSLNQDLNTNKFKITPKDLTLKNIKLIAKRNNIELPDTSEYLDFLNIESVNDHILTYKNGHSGLHVSHHKDLFSIKLKTKYNTTYLTQHYPSKPNCEWELNERLASYYSFYINELIYNLLPKKFEARKFLKPTLTKEKILIDFVYWLAE